MASATSRRERQAAPVYVEPEATGNYEGEELRRIRARRPTPQRIERLEDKHDLLVVHVADLREGFGRVEGQLELLVEQGKEQAIQRAADAELVRAEKLDVVAGRKWTRDQIGRVIAAVASGGVLTALLALLAKRCS